MFTLQFLFSFASNCWATTISVCVMCQRTYKSQAVYYYSCCIWLYYTFRHVLCYTLQQYIVCKKGNKVIPCQKQHRKETFQTWPLQNWMIFLWDYSPCGENYSCKISKPIKCSFQWSITPVYSAKLCFQSLQSLHLTLYFSKCSVFRFLMFQIICTQYLKKS